MCGIAGLIIKRNTRIDIKDAMHTMIQKIHHRGPDGEGYFFFENIALGHKRLAIIDRSTDGHQPMHYLDGRLTITFNGEIYNYIELRQSLESLGYTFRSHTDTEVILAAYAHWGQSCVERFNGMWAFAIFDSVSKSIFCSRDRFGVKPFYYIDTPEIFAFGSEIKQLLPFLHRQTANQVAIVNFILTSVADNNRDTFFNEVIKLDPGCNLLYESQHNRYSIASYYTVRLNSTYAMMSEADAIETYMALLEDAVKLRLRADVAVGTCLSGGLDSSTVASIAAPLYQSIAGRKFNGITAVSEQQSNNEAAYAKQVIESASMTWLPVQPGYSDFLDSLSDIVLTQEEPFGSTSLTMQYYVMKTAREHGIPVLLDGQGGDETLLGYEKYYGSHLMSILRQKGIRAFITAIQSAGANNTKLTLPNAMKHLLGGSLGKLRFQYFCHKHRYLLQKSGYPDFLARYSQSILNPFELQKLEIESTNLPILLRYEDKNSMAHSIETRLPFLDYRVVEAALSLPGKYKIKDGWTKWLLRKGMEKRMPDSIVWRKNKFGFEAPESLWLKQHYNEMNAVVQRSSMLKDLSKPGVLQKKYRYLDSRSQWRLYSVALWETAFGITR